MMSTGGPPQGAIHKTARSRDGASIAYEQTGAGPVAILVSAALADRDGARPLARRLASSFTVINYDRRGRGESSDAAPNAVEREVEDLEALCGAAGEPVFLFGSSSGAGLALDAGSRLGARPDSLAHEIEAAVAGPGGGAVLPERDGPSGGGRHLHAPVPAGLARYGALDHSAVLMAPDALAGAMRRYFTPDR